MKFKVSSRSIKLSMPEWLNRSIRRAKYLSLNYHHKCGESNFLYCPYCGAPLMYNGETITCCDFNESVMDLPPCKRSKLICSEYCNMSNGVCWIESGESFAEIEYKTDKIYTSAIGSRMFVTELSTEKQYINDIEKIIKLPWILRKLLSFDKLYITYNIHTDCFGDIKEAQKCILPMLDDGSVKRFFG